MEFQNQDGDGGTFANLFSKAQMERKRKLSSPETFRPSKVLITEARLSQELDNLSLDLTTANDTPLLSSPVETASGATNVEPETWRTFLDDMDVDIEPSGRRVCPQLEMSESLKAALRQIDQEEATILPAAIANEIMPMIQPQAYCMALVPYNPPPVYLAFSRQNVDRCANKPSSSVISSSTAALPSPALPLSVDVPMEESDS
ncbi:hypothetical protein BV898_01001 [Hypsibius exemplaris]|uniref:Uncharacterized protein n=1 Tax=Hypsibius exemplaris TaxID=2072580 RepID=A0A1W0XCV9_HYPEX|nr:hypothetical protein BV898_01001 [Hypsibius exemplaris]